MKEMRNIELEHQRVRSARIICIIYCIFLFSSESVLYDVLCGFVLSLSVSVFVFSKFQIVFYVLSTLERKAVGNVTIRSIVSKC